MTEIHLSNPDDGASFCGQPATVITEAGDTRPVCQTCHRGAMKHAHARAETTTALPRPGDGCQCTWHNEDRGGGHYELVAEYEPACPEHSEHVWNPRTGMWEHRADTTTATTEDAESVVLDVLDDGHPSSSRFGLAQRIAQALAAAGLLATARTRPTREAIEEAIEAGKAAHDDAVAAAGAVGPQNDYIAEEVDALLNHDQPTEAEAGARARADLLAYLIDNFNRQHAQVAVDTPEEGYSGLSWHEWADGTRNGMEKLIYTVRYLAEHPEYTERAARLRGGAR